MQRLPTPFAFASALLLLALAAPAARAADDGDIPDKAETRAAITALIKDLQTRKAPLTLGVVQQIIDLSISFGAPTWNAGDHNACCTFYKTSVEALLAAFPAETDATPVARLALQDLKKALARTKGSDDVDKNAWSLRFAFDKTRLAVEADFSRTDGLVTLGSENLKRSSFDEAEDAFASAEIVLQEMDGYAREQLPAACRLVPLFHANALIGLKKYSQAAAAVQRGIVLIPEWRDTRYDLRGQFESPDVFESLMDDLKADAAKSPKDASLQFLLGYQLYFTGHKAAAKTQFELALKLDPHNAGAKIFLNAPAKPGPATKPRNPIKI